MQRRFAECVVVKTNQARRISDAPEARSRLCSRGSVAADRAAPAIAPVATRAIIGARGIVSPRRVIAAITKTIAAITKTTSAPPATAPGLRRRRGRADQDRRRADDVDKQQGDRRQAARQEIIAF